MYCQAIRLLPGQEAGRIVAELEQSKFADGKLTASGYARDVKNNLQLDREGQRLIELDKAVFSLFQSSKEFQAFAIPRRITSPIFSRYDPGMRYGSHVDNAMMGSTGDVRADCAVTLFLSAPDSYDGGELVVEFPFGEQRIKLDAGEAIVYPASTVHHVAPVTRGVRYAAVTWVQSMIRDERMRGVLYDISRSLHYPEVAGSPEITLLLTKSYHNLLRYAADS
jgi:PKHD-type hydroxylase